MRLLMVLLWFAIVGAVSARVVMRTDMPTLATICIWTAAFVTVGEGLVMLLRAGRRRR